jgi:hypothetical protein
MGKREFDLVIATDRAPAALREYAANGGRVLLLSSRPPEFPLARVIGTTADLPGYVRLRDHALFPSLKDTDLLLLSGPFTGLEANGAAALTLVPPSMIGPPEKIHVDMKDTAVPAVWSTRIGQGAITWVPWELGALYYRLSLPAHAGLFRDLLDQLYPRRQVKTNAHALVGMTLMRQEGRTLVHVINFSGQSQTGYFAPIPMRDIRVELLGDFKTARTVRNPATLPLQKSNGYTGFTIPTLADYELVVIE